MCYIRSFYWIFLKAVSPPPILGLPLEERTHRAQVSFMAKEISLLFSLGPKVDGIREGLDGLAVAADEGAAEVDAFEVVLLALKVGDLTDIVTVDWS